MHVKGTIRQNINEQNKLSNVKPVGKSFNTKHNPKSMSFKNIQNIQNPTANNERITANPSTVPKNGNRNRTFLGRGQPSPPQHPPPPRFQHPPPPQHPPQPRFQEAVGTGSGEEMKLMMNLMHQILQALHTGTQQQVQQTQAVQFHAHPLMAQPQGRHPITFQTQ